MFLTNRSMSRSRENACLKQIEMGNICFLKMMIAVLNANPNDFDIGFDSIG